MKKGQTEKLVKAAEQIVKQIVERVGYYSETPPTVKVVADRVSIVWEEGPYEWTTNDNYGLHEELVNIGYEGEYKHKPYWDEIPGIFVEAINSWSVGVYFA